MLPLHPSPTPREQMLRQEVGRLRIAESRRRFPARICVGELGGAHVSHEFAWPEPEEYDAALRFCLVEALLVAVSDRADQSWLVRPGRPMLHDVDVDWWSETRQAFAARSVPLGGFAVVTRSGWFDPLTGETRAWKRLRLNR